MLEKRCQFLTKSALAVPAGSVLVHGDEASLGLHAGHDRGHRTGGIGRLLIRVVRLGQCEMREPLKRERALLTAVATQLTGGVFVRQ